MFTIEKIEYRPAKTGEWVWDRISKKPIKALGLDENRIVLIGYEPEKFVPKEGEDYYMPEVRYDELYDEDFWDGADATDKFRLKHNLVYPYTEEGKAQAIEHAKRMLGV